MKSKLIFLGGIIALFVLYRFSINNTDLHNAPKEQSTQTQYENLSANEALSLLGQEDNLFLLDVHTPEQEHLGQTDAFIPFDKIIENKTSLPQDKSTPIIVYCRSGNMSIDASEDLIDLGYTKVYNLSGGIHAWEGAGLPIDWNQDTN